MSGRTAAAGIGRSRSPWKGLCLVLGALVIAVAVPARAQPASDPIRLGIIEGFSGAFANAGESVARNLQFALDRVNARGGVRLPEGRRPLALVRFDSKGQTEEALVMLRAATDRRTPFVLQGNSSAVAAALSDAVARHNEREPGNRQLFLNYSAVDPALTNERCSFWHFRFDANAEMRMSALADALAANPAVGRVYLINQDYSFGREVSRLARLAIKARRPDVEIVGDELHPLGRVKDFSPYAAKIAQSGADTIVTGNWGNDLTQLVRAIRESGVPVSFYTFYGNSLGAPSAIGEAGVERVRAVAEWHPNAGLPGADQIYREFRATLKDQRDDYFNMRHVVMIEMLVAAIEEAGTTEALAVARALEGRTQPAPPYQVTMRRDDHQLLTPLYVSVMTRAGGDPGAVRPVAIPGTVRYDVEGSGFGFRTELFIRAPQNAQEPRCTMVRPQK